MTKAKNIICLFFLFILFSCGSDNNQSTTNSQNTITDSIQEQEAINAAEEMMKEESMKDSSNLSNPDSLSISSNKSNLTK